MTESTSPLGAPPDPPRSGGAHRHPIAAHPVASTFITLLLVATIFFTVYTPLYVRITPMVGSWPFFYAYLMIYMPVVAIALWITMLLQRRLLHHGGKGGTNS